MAGGRVAIKRVFSDVEVKRRQINGHEIEQRLINFAEIIARIIFAHQRVQFAKPMQHIAFQFRHVGGVNFFIRFEMRQIAQQKAEAVPHFAISIRIGLNDFRPHARIFAIVRRHHPQADNLGTRLPDHFLRVDRIADGFRHFPALFIHRKTMRDHLLVGCLAACGTCFQKGRMKPAAMLVGTFKINIGRPLQIVARFQNKRMRYAAVEPDIENICYALIVRRRIFRAQKILRVFIEPRIGTFLAHRLDNAGVHIGVAQNLAGFAVHK